MNEEKKTCRKCGEDKPLRKFRTRTKVNGLAIDNICMACRGKSKYSRLKLEMLEAFGWKCSCCGVDHPYFLSLEHINGIEGGRLQTYSAYRKAKREGWDKTQYECLCMNCNFAKGHFGQCPHRTEITKEQVYESLREASKGIGISFRNPKGFGQFKDGSDSRRPSKQEVDRVIKEIE